MTATVGSALVRTPCTRAFDRMVRLIKAEFDEMPCMRLTRAQFQRLWHITEAECDAIVRHLVDVGFLVETARGVGRPPDC